AKDEETVVFHLKHPWGAFPSAVTGPGAVSYMHSPTAVKEMGKDYNRHPVGTGPFLFKEWRSGDRVVVERNPNYWGKPAFLDKVVFRLLPDPESRYASLLTKDVDVIWTDRPTHILKAKKREDLVVMENGGAGALTTFLNHAKPPLDDWRVRKALQLAFDNEAFVKAARKGVNPPAFHFLGPKFSEYCLDFKHPGPDLERARKLIKEYGKPVKVVYTHTTTIRGRNGALIAQQMWKKIGVETVMNPVDQATLVRKVVTGDYMISGWRMVDEIDDFQDIQVVGTFYSKSPANYEHYKNPEMDKLVIAGRMEADRKKREEIYCKIVKLVTRDVPLLYRGGFVSRVILLPDVKGVQLNTAGRVITKYAWLDR
ncbi:MAG: ABC transporter substrate-binding protein, partial [Candidatus Methylomirabilales bacterium]